MSILRQWIWTLDLWQNVGGVPGKVDDGLDNLSLIGKQLREFTYGWAHDHKRSP
jgi:hypothetical protein